MSRDWHCVPPRAANWDTPTRSHPSKGDLLIDGRNRLPACLDLGIEPKVREFGEADSGGIGGYIIAANIYRRHLDPDQQIMIGSKAIKWMVAEPSPRAAINRKSSDGRSGRPRPQEKP